MTTPAVMTDDDFSGPATTATTMSMMPLTVTTVLVITPFEMVIVFDGHIGIRYSGKEKVTV